MPKHTILKMKDNSDSFTRNKGDLPDLPQRLVITMPSGGGKTNILANIMLREQYNRKDYEPENIFIFSGSLKGDHKIQTIIKELDVPAGNVFTGYDENVMEHIYKELTERYSEAIRDGVKPEHSLVVFDDVSYTNAFSKSSKQSMVDKLFCNSRKFLVSVIVIQQKYTQLNTCARENLSALILGKSTNKQINLIEEDFNYLPSKKIFQDMIRRETPTKHSFIVFTPNKNDVYRDSNFKPLSENKLI